jgi:hypothetical protein
MQQVIRGVVRRVEEEVGDVSVSVTDVIWKEGCRKGV